VAWPRPGAGAEACRRDERGAVTAELTMALPMLVVVTCALAWVLALGSTQLRLVDAAREVARAVARGDDQQSAIEVGRRVAPEGARFTVVTQGGQVVVGVSAPAGDRGPAESLLPDLTLRAEATALAEEDP
jgi:hypothetical protein